MTKDTFSLKQLSTLILPLSSPNSKLEPETSLDFLFQQVSPLLLLFPSSSETPSKISLLYLLNQGNFIENLDTKSRKSKLLAVLQLLPRSRLKNKSPRNKPKRKSPRRKLPPHPQRNRTWIWETSLADRI
jgi:hypothetical protein